MKILVVGLTYGNRPKDILKDNLLRAGYPFDYKEVSREGISNALNEGIDYALVDEYDAIAFLANDIIEPDNWLSKKSMALYTYPKAGIVASSLDHNRFTLQSEHVISNWLMSRNLIEEIGYFNEEMFPYGPIDLDYCQRANLAGFNTYYVMDCLAKHQGGHASGDEYGWNKSELVSKYWQMHVDDCLAYSNGTKSLKIWKPENK